MSRSCNWEKEMDKNMGEQDEQNLGRVYSFFTYAVMQLLRESLSCFLGRN